jgi:acyl-CoA synthetase (NDP forming)
LGNRRAAPERHKLVTRDVVERAMSGGQAPVRPPATHAGVALGPDLHGGTAVAQGAAFVAQSGNLTLNATMAERSLALTHMLSIGNQAVTGFGACVDVLLDDPRVRAVGLYVERIDDLAGFSEQTPATRPAAWHG